MKEIFDKQIRIYKSLRAELAADSDLTDHEKAWILTNIQTSITNHNELVELDRA